MAVATLEAETIESVLENVYAWSRGRGYRGYNKHDGLNSPLLRVALGWAKWPRVFAIQAVMRFPLNVRPLLLVPKTFNPKGLALFVVGLLDRYHATGQERHLAEATSLLDRLVGLRAPGAWSGICWGYAYPWQDIGFFAPPHTPNAVVTCFVGEAFLEAYRVTGKAEYVATVESSARFLLQDLTVLKDTDDQLCLAYMPMRMSMRVMDVSILIGSLLAQLATLTGNAAYRPPAEKLLNYVIAQQTDYGAWYYTDPPRASPIRHDNYHTGFILDALSRYMQATQDFRWSEKYALGLRFYADQLFNADGAPRWMSDCNFPHDIHGAAQGILTFARHLSEFPGKAESIARWALDTMYCESGRFYYQQRRLYKKRFTLMRWCNAWMARALACLLRSKTGSHN
jgi:rhamnogalacturonyl hydrolase YesR